MFLYIGLMDLGRVFDNHSRNGKRAFASENCPLGHSIDQFFQMPAVCPGDARGWNWLAPNIVLIKNVSLQL